MAVVCEVENGRVKFERMDVNKTWTYNWASNQITKTEPEHVPLETTVYTDADGNGLLSKNFKTDWV